MANSYVRYIADAEDETKERGDGNTVISVNRYLTLLNPDGDNYTGLTLANGVYPGQLKKILISNLDIGTTSTITVTQLQGGNTITIDNDEVNNGVTLIWTGIIWAPIELLNTAISTV